MPAPVLRVTRRRHAPRAQRVANLVAHELERRDSERALVAGARVRPQAFERAAHRHVVVVAVARRRESFGRRRGGPTCWGPRRIAGENGPAGCGARSTVPALVAVRRRGHQAARPSSLIAAGSTIARTTDASSATASAAPNPTSLTSAWRAVISEPRATASNSAAAVTMRPLRSRPRWTASVSPAPASLISRIRDSRKIP